MISTNFLKQFESITRKCIRICLIQIKHKTLCVFNQKPVNYDLVLKKTLYVSLGQTPAPKNIKFLLHFYFVVYLTYKCTYNLFILFDSIYFTRFYCLEVNFLEKKARELKIFLVDCTTSNSVMVQLIFYVRVFGLN